jgi:hypothetical protein
MWRLTAIESDKRVESVESRETEAMGQDYNDTVETQLAMEMINLFQRERLTASQAKSLLDKVRTLIEAGKMGLFSREH